MAHEGLIPKVLGDVHPKRQTPVAATTLVAAAVFMLALFVPLFRLAELTSFVMLAIFASVNVSLYLIGRHPDAASRLPRWRWWGVSGAVVALLLGAVQALS